MTAKHLYDKLNMWKYALEDELVIYTVTLNPSIDYLMHPAAFSAGEINRSEYEKHTYGGKGINVSAMLANLGVKTRALGFVGGYSGEEIAHLARRAGIECDFCKICEPSRINVKICASPETEINGKGPFIRIEEERLLLEKLYELTEEDTVIISGSAPESESGVLVENVLDACGMARIVADMSGEALQSAIMRRPYLIKPNIAELCELFGTSEMTEEEVAGAAAKLRSQGVRNVAVSLGEKGAILASEDENIYRMRAPQIDVVSTVGAGDSFLAGFLAGEKNSPQFALALGVAAGSATASCDGIADGALVMDIFSKM